MGAAWSRVLEECRRGLEECRAAYKRFLESVCPDRSKCSRGAGGYDWVESLISRGVPEGRKRLILYVISRYLVNVKGLEPGEAEEAIQGFIDASCSNHGNCGRIYRSWVRHVVSRVSAGGWRPWSLERIKREDPQLYEVISGILKGSS